jgi:hypothetical protein
MKILLPFVIISLLFGACQEKVQHSDSVINATVDSIVGTRMEEINRRAMEDLDQRMTIEVKSKTDSIITARRAANREPAGSENPDQ